MTYGSNQVRGIPSHGTQAFQVSLSYRPSRGLDGLEDQACSDVGLRFECSAQSRCTRPLIPLSTTLQIAGWVTLRCYACASSLTFLEAHQLTLSESLI